MLHGRNKAEGLELLLVGELALDRLHLLALLQRSARRSLEVPKLPIGLKGVLRLHLLQREGMLRAVCQELIAGSL